jgi:hypothetical protein
LAAFSLKKDLKMDNATARVMGGVYLALCTALSEEGARLAHDVLYGLADSPLIRREDARIYRLIAGCASGDIGEPEAELPRLRIVGGLDHGADKSTNDRWWDDIAQMRVHA